MSQRSYSALRICNILLTTILGLKKIGIFLSIERTNRRVLEEVIFYYKEKLR